MYTPDEVDRIIKAGEGGTLRVAWLCFAAGFLAGALVVAAGLAAGVLVPWLIRA
jgi:hypothetical protein